MQTHFSRVRKDFSESQARCWKRRDRHARRKGKESRCQLPDECEFCKHWVCNACEEIVSWGDGGGEDMSDGGGMLCDTCWCKFVRDWLVEEELLEAGRLRQYNGACAL